MKCFVLFFGKTTPISITPTHTRALVVGILSGPMNHGEAAPFGRRDQAWQPKQSTVGDGCHRHNSARKQKLHSMRLDAKLNVFKRIYRLSVRGCVVNVFPFFFLQWVTVASIQLFPSLPRLNCIKLTHFLALLAFLSPFLVGIRLARKTPALSGNPFTELLPPFVIIPATSAFPIGFSFSKFPACVNPVAPRTPPTLVLRYVLT